MAARAIWKGELLLGELRLPVKLYSAVEDRAVHFRMLHARDLAPVEQRIFRKSDGKEVPREEQRKAYQVDAQTAVILQPEDMETLEPPPSRDIEFCQFIPAGLLSDQWFDRPYYLGPDGHTEDYFACAEALRRQEVIGIARWVMRKQRYLGALSAIGGYLTMTTLRRADQVLSFAGVEPEKTTAPHANEIKLAEQLVRSIAGKFDPKQWHSEYRDRVRAMAEAKARGRTIAPFKPRKRAVQGDLAASLKASIAAARGRRVA